MDEPGRVGVRARLKRPLMTGAMLAIAWSGAAGARPAHEAVAVHESPVASDVGRPLYARAGQAIVAAASGSHAGRQLSAGGGQAAALPERRPPIPHLSWRDDEALTRLFTPVAAPPGIYRVSVTGAPIEQVAAAFARLPGADPDAWKITSAGLTDAFGTEGPYDRARLARLINGGRIRAARGSVSPGGETVAYTLVTPVPDRSLSTLAEGTMILAVDAERLMQLH
jgi:hypothetical protein